MPNSLKAFQNALDRINAGGECIADMVGQLSESTLDRDPESARALSLKAREKITDAVYDAMAISGQESVSAKLVLKTVHEAALTEPDPELYSVLTGISAALQVVTGDKSDPTQSRKLRS